MASTTNTTQWWRWAIVVVIGAVIAHTCGYRFAVANQLTYFVDPLHRAHPELFHTDWLVTSTDAYHRVFSICAAWLYRLDDSCLTSTAVTHFVLMVAHVVALYAIVTAVTENYRLTAFAILIGFIALAGERSVAGSYLWANYLQPSTVGTVGWLFALAFILRGRYLATGIALAAGGIFHLNFLVIGLGAFTALALICDRQPKKLLWLLAPQILVLAIVSPDLFAATSSKEGELGLWVLTVFHAPIHYGPHAVLHSMPMFVLWSALGIAVAPMALQNARPELRKLIWWIAIVAAICIGGSLIIYIPPLRSLTRLYPWRLAPFGQIGAQIVIALAAIAPSRMVWWRTSIAGGLAIAIAIGTYQATWYWPIVFALGGLAFIAPLRRFTPYALLVACLFIPLRTSKDAILHPPSGIEIDPPTAELFAWAQTTPTDTLFLTPPILASFRLLARRSIIVDFKSPPLQPDDLATWFRRLNAEVGLATSKSKPEVRKAWDAATPAALLTNARALGANYLVLEAGRTLPATPAAFTNSEYVVYRVD